MRRDHPNPTLRSTARKMLGRIGAARASLGGLAQTRGFATEKQREFRLSFSAAPVHHTSRLFLRFRHNL